MGATLSQPFIPLLPRSIKVKSKRFRFRFRLRLRMRWKRKQSHSEIRALFPTPDHDHQQYRESKLYDSSCTENEEKSPLPVCYTFNSASSSTAPTAPDQVAEKIPGAVNSLNESIRATGTLLGSFSESPQNLMPVPISKEKPLPLLPEPPLPSPVHHTPSQQTQTSTPSELQSSVSQAADTSVTEAEQGDDDETEHDISDSDFPVLHRCPNPERPHTPPPWDTSLTGYGSVLEVSRPFRARRVFEHPLVEGHFWGNMGNADSFAGGGPIAAAAKRKGWREQGGREFGMKEKKKKKSKSKRMSEWRRWKPLPTYPACTSVAQRASTWASSDHRAWAAVVEEVEERGYQAEDEKEEEKDIDEEDDGENEEDDEDLEEAIKRFLEMKIPVDLNSLRRLRTSFAEAGDNATGSGTGGAAEGLVKEKEDISKVMEGEQDTSSPFVESLMFRMKAVGREMHPEQIMIYLEESDPKSEVIPVSRKDGVGGRGRERTKSY
ncbi:hypothetical protein QBC32DRAFT_384852 [Pseudoneurospora amorphoporcata]|uniref:Uncharacterized protein n=1 Tax=Pseudoneurospora amorphoporcata TaxID=241081 RepID=A0AAN6NKN5_9PEZI|nr:hypothetical protein QBC32DRAFT_384852 [Pseudoneurospora amorphoporcata]